NSEFDVLEDIFTLLDGSIHPDAPFSVREGGLIQDGYSEEVDALRDVLVNGKQWIVELELRERERTGIKTLKVSYNKVFGYYIDITRSKSGDVPEEYVRKQTLANSERFITPELKELESRVLGADEKLKELEYQLFVQLRNAVGEQVARILKTAHIIAQLDCLFSLGQAAVYHNFCKPVISEDGQYLLKDCRHPVVEEKLKDGWFIPNDVHFHPEQERFLIITGPNMAGKSTYCRSVAVASVLMQIGSFVPAREAVMPVVDRVFARIGASDDLSTGQSTFMVEMNEVANIVNNATKDSLIILDEVGRGTSTYDGLAIAWALTDYINNTIQAKTMFATHYHELTALEEQPGIRNYSVAVKEDGEKITFLRKIIAGGADRSYGIHVASLAGIPEAILQHARDVLRTLELEKEQHRPKANQMELFAAQPETEPQPQVQTIVEIPEVVQELASVNVNNLTPMDAMNLLFALQRKAQEVVAHGAD
ncbi:MAG: DNA mismatch repair protein MutS, partial [Peptococcaceae bacterium]|nr:DNA mismatch repair protein MutS [Peptococcaceae bacterium]